MLLVPITTLAQAMRRLGLNRLRNLDPKPPMQRYQWERPSEIIHVNIKQLARFVRVGHQLTGDRARLLTPGWLREDPRGRGWRHPSVLRGGPARREGSDHGGHPEPSGGLVQRPRD